MIRYVLASVILLSGCSGSSSQAPASPTAPTPPGNVATVHVFGRALDFTTNAPVSGASINFYIEGLPTIASSVTTDASGRYSVSLTRGVWYNPRINGVDVDSNRGRIRPVAKETEADFLINGGTCIAFYGTVRDATTGEPLSGAVVGFDRISTKVQTGADGSYRLDLGCPTAANPWRPPGTFGTTFMTATRDGYQLGLMYGTRIEGLSSAHTQRIDVALQPAS